MKRMAREEKRSRIIEWCKWKSEGLPEKAEVQGRYQRAI